ncbi:TonB periplasmic protein (plasmid) [Acetobacter pasteurianus 386B]|nr:TonB periplasmic protein [Acetobacter pasteurianus 386B]
MRLRGFTRNGRCHVMGMCGHHMMVLGRAHSGGQAHRAFWRGKARTLLPCASGRCIQDFIGCGEGSCNIHAQKAGYGGAGQFIRLRKALKGEQAEKAYQCHHHQRQFQQRMQRVGGAGHQSSRNSCLCGPWWVGPKVGRGFALFIYERICVKRMTAAKVIFLIEGGGERYKITGKSPHRPRRKQAGTRAGRHKWQGVAAVWVLGCICLVLWVWAVQDQRMKERGRVKPHGRLGQDDDALTPDVRARLEGGVFSARQSRTSRVWHLALLAAVVGHGVITACLLVTFHPWHPSKAPGQKAVEMVFESPVSKPVSAANLTSVTPPQELVPTPEQVEPLSVPPTANLFYATQSSEITPPDEALASSLGAPPMPADTPPVPRMTNIFPPVATQRAAPAHEHRPSAHSSQISMPRKAAVPSTPKTSLTSHSPKVATPPVSTSARTAASQIQLAPAAQNSAAAQPAAASVAHVANGSGARTLTCSPPQTHYPPMARHLHEEGEGVVEVTLAADGAIATTRLVQSTGYDDLDAQALAAARGLHCVAPASTPMVGRIPVGFHIR